jgi:hypothetical protein
LRIFSNFSPRISLTNSVYILASYLNRKYLKQYKPIYKFPAAMKNIPKPNPHPNDAIELERESIPAPTAVLIRVRMASLREPSSSFPKVL